MMLLLVISAAVTIFLFSVAVILMMTGEDAVDARLEQIGASEPVSVTAVNLRREARGGLARGAVGLNTFFKPIRDIISGTDSDLEYRLTLAGLRRPEHPEIYMALKMLLPVVGVVAGTFWRSNLITGILLGAIAGFFGPDLFLSRLIARRRDSIRLALPDALDLLMICMEAGLGIDQALVRVGEEIRIISPALAEEFQIISREQRAGKPRLDAWRSVTERVDLEVIRHFVTMLVQTERFGTPIAHALGQFADNMRMRRTQAAEEVAAKTGVKLIFPLVICIFPSIFVVTLGPAILNIQKSFEQFFNK